jgi:hypothetical protein
MRQWPVDAGQLAKDDRCAPVEGRLVFARCPLFAVPRRKSAATFVPPRSIADITAILGD